MNPRRVRGRDVDACGAVGCGRRDGLEAVTHPENGEKRVLCPRHRKHFLRISS